MKKRIFAIVLCLIMAFTSVNFAFATEDTATGGAASETSAASSEVESPEIDDIIWIKSGSKVYKSQEDTDGHTLIVNYKVKIKDIITDEDGVAQWYKFDFTTGGIGEWFLKEYKYVKVENTSVEEPEEEPDNPVTPEEPEDTDSGLDVEYVQYAGTAANGIAAKILAPEGAFPEGTSVSVTEDDVAVSEIKSIIKDNIKGVVSVDIDFSGKEPTEDVMVSLNLPAHKIPANANKVIIVHMAKNGPEVVGTKYIDTTDKEETISFSTDSFSSYVVVFVQGKYNAQKMSTVLEGNSRYQIATFNVDLFDYDPVEINEALNSATSDRNGFHFTGYGVAGCTSNTGINNSEAAFAKQGILEDSLLDGFPVIKYLNGADAGSKTGKILFDDNYTVDEATRTVYNDIPFEFIYDSQTGYYEYKSSVNHAQLNADKNKIELYADTLSTQNNYVATVDLSTAAGVSDFKTGYTATTSSFEGTVSDTTNNGRLDPYMTFTVDDVAAADVGQIYVKAKVPDSVGANGFQLFFTTNNSTGASEDKSFGNPDCSKAIPYTANGDWIEFVIDTSENPNWKDTIKSVRVDLFDNNKGSLDVTGEYPIEISQISFIKKDYNAYATYGGFYPFSEIQDSYPGNNTAFNLETWKTDFFNDGLTMKTASRSIYNPAPNPATDLYSELAFGTVCEFDFYLPVDKKGLDGEDLTYYFNGDDDLWVFVDGQLVLDIGGGHGAITGNVNFTNGKWEVANATNVTGYNSGANTAASKKDGAIDEALYSAGKHTMKIFYLERGGSVSNCFMKFNLPRTPQGTVVVDKKAIEKNNANNDILSSTGFEFQVKIQNNGTGDYQNVTPLANTEYYEVNADGTTVQKQTNAEGKFILKHDQSAHFNIDENYNVTVEEIKKEIADHEWISTTVNGTEGFSSTQLTANGVQSNFNFVNTYERLYGNLIISKTGIEEIDHDSNEKQSTVYVVEGTSSKGESVNLEVCIDGNGQRTIKNVPIGTYTVKEKADWSWRYVPESNERDVTIVGGETLETKFKNERTKIYWLNGGAYCQNLFSKIPTIN